MSTLFFFFIFFFTTPFSKASYIAYEDFEPLMFHLKIKDYSMFAEYVNSNTHLLLTIFKYKSNGITLFAVPNEIMEGQNNGAFQFHVVLGMYPLAQLFNVSSIESISHQQLSISCVDEKSLKIEGWPIVAPDIFLGQHIAVHGIKGIINPQAQAEPPSSVPSVSFTSFKTELIIEAPKAKAAVLFYQAAFGAVEIDRVMVLSDFANPPVIPAVGSTDLMIGGTVFSVVVANPTAFAFISEGVIGSVILRLETSDVEGAVARAVDAGAVASHGGALTYDLIYGRYGVLKDPYGYTWIISSKVVKWS